MVVQMTVSVVSLAFALPFEVNTCLNSFASLIILRHVLTQGLPYSPLHVSSVGDCRDPIWMVDDPVPGPLAPESQIRGRVHGVHTTGRVLE